MVQLLKGIWIGYLTLSLTHTQFEPNCPGLNIKMGLTEENNQVFFEPASLSPKIDRVRQIVTEELELESITIIEPPESSSTSSRRSSRQSLHLSVNSPMHLSVLSAKSLNSLNSLETNPRDKVEENKIETQKLERKDKIICAAQYGLYSLLFVGKAVDIKSISDVTAMLMAVTFEILYLSALFVGSAFIAMMIWVTSRSGDNQDRNKIQMNVSSNSCPFWEITNDGYCDDEANIADCGYDYKDCCKMENDNFLLCEECLCFLREDEKESILQEQRESCNETDSQVGFFVHSPVNSEVKLGNGICDLDKNNMEHFFDVGDCCLEDLTCQLEWVGLDRIGPMRYFEEIVCPKNTCVKSNNFCIQEELGNGICEDHNNGPYCDYDLGDCCLSLEHSDQTMTQSNCCQCSCKLQQTDYYLTG